MKKLQEISLLEILPESVLQDPKIKASAAALDFQFRKVTNAIRQVLHIPRLDELHGTILDYLAEQFHLDFYEPLYLSEDEKRNLIRESVAWHRVKGTKYAVEKIARDAFKNVDIQEWYEYEGGKPYWFRISSHGFKQTPDGWDTFIRMINAAKNVRSWVDNFEIVLDETDLGINQTFAGVANFLTGIKTIEPAKPDLNYEAHAFAQNVEYLYGGLTESLRPPKLKFEVGCFYEMLNSRTGKIRIDSKTRPADDSHRIIETWENKFFVGNANFVFGRKTIGLEPRKVEVSKVFAENLNIASGFIKISPDLRRNLTWRTILHAAQVMKRVGKIQIGSETQSTTDENIFALTRKSKVYASTVTHKSGIVKIRDSSPRSFGYKGVVRVGMTNTFSGFITIGTATKPSDIPSGTLILCFASGGRRRIVTVENPRNDLTDAEILSTGAVMALYNGRLITVDIPEMQGLTLCYRDGERRRLVNVPNPTDDISHEDISATGASEAIYNGQLIDATAIP